MAVDVSKHLERAQRYLERNRLEEAIDAYLAVLEVAPNHLEGMLALGDLYTRLDKPERASQYYGLLFDRLHDPHEEARAIALYTRFLKPFPQPPDRQARYALLLQKQNKPEEAIEQYTAAAEAFVARQEDEEALLCWERVAQLEPDNPER